MSQMLSNSFYDSSNNTLVKGRMVGYATRIMDLKKLYKTKKLSMEYVSLLILLSIIFLNVLAIKKLLFFPFPEMFIFPYLVNHSLLPYKQIFDQHFPALLFLPINFSTLGINNERIARFWLMGLVAATHLMIFFITKAITGEKRKALLANALFLVWQPFFGGWAFWIDSFLALFLLPAFYFSYRFIAETKPSRYFSIILIGVFLSIAIVFKQTLIPLTGFVFLYLLLHARSIKTPAFFLIGFLPLPLVILIYFMKIHVLGDFWHWGFVFNLTTAIKYSKKAPELIPLLQMLFVYLPVVFVLKLKNKKITLLLFIFILGALLGFTDRFDSIHLQPSLPFVCIALSLIFFEVKNMKMRIFLTTLSTIVCAFWLVSFYQQTLSTNVLFFDRNDKNIGDMIKSYTHPGEEIFIFDPLPLLYTFSNTMPAGRTFTLLFPWNMVEVQDRTLDSLKLSKPALIIRDRTVVIDGNPITHYAEKIDKYINDNYVVFNQVGSVEFLRKE